mgnify:CR=1 FL=1
MENEEKRMLGDYEVKQSIHIGKKEVVFGVNEADKYPFMVCYCTYDNPLSAAWPTEGVGTDDYLKQCRYLLTECRHRLKSSKRNNPDLILI